MHEAIPLRSLQGYGYIIRGAAGTLALRILAACLTLTLSWFLARSLGVTDYGTYIYALAWIHFLATPACLGTDRLLVRLVAVYCAEKRWAMVRGVLRWSDRLALTASLALALVASGVCLQSSSYINQAARQTFLISLLALPFLVLTTLRQSALQAMQQVLRGQLSESVFRPLLALGLLASVYFAYGGHLSAALAAGLYVVASVAALRIAGKLLRDSLPSSFKDSPAEYKSKEWKAHAMPLLLVAASGTISTHTETLILGALKGMEAVGYFTVANRGAELIFLALMILSVPLAPAYARLWARREVKELERVARLATYASLLLALPLTLALIFRGQTFLSLFGQEFAQARPALAILSAGQLFNVMMGSVALLLIMSGHEREVAVATMISIIIKILLCALLIERLGAAGAAFARSGSLVAWNLLLARSVYKKLTINPTALGRPGLPRRG
ncbi:MAG: flippase [Acidobacteriota bacterium]|nr:flippase [Acidobacteriota bacterium]